MPPSAVSSAPAPAGESTVPAWLTLLLATACGLIAANVYYAQPLVGPISAAIGLSPGAAGLIVTFTQIGYGAGLLFVVPLGDLVENRILVFTALAGCTLALLAAAVRAACRLASSPPRSSSASAPSPSRSSCPMRRISRRRRCAGASSATS